MKISTRTARRLAWSLGLALLGTSVAGAQETSPFIAFSRTFAADPAAFALDAHGNVYIAGSAWRGLHGYDAFVARLSPSGDLAHVTFFGGSDSEDCSGIALDAAGNLYLAGRTSSFDFPATGPVILDHNRFPYSYLVKLSPDGTSVLYSHLVPGNWYSPPGLAVDARGFAALVGYLEGDEISGWWNYLVQVDPSGQIVNQKVWDPYGTTPAVAKDPAGNVYVAGTDGLCFGLSEGGDAFVMKLGPTGGDLYWSCIGGSGGEIPTAVAADADGNAYVTGITGSGGGDAFVIKLDRTGSPVYSTDLGGTKEDRPAGIAVDGEGRASITGFTRSIDFPLVDPLRDVCTTSSRGVCHDAFVTRLDAGGSVDFSTFLGGTEWDEARAIAVDSHGDLYVTGSTGSPDFPLVGAPATELPSGSFVTKIAFNRPPACTGATASPATLWPPNGRLVPVAIRGVTDPDGDPLTLSVTTITQDEPLSRRGVPDTAGLGTPTPQVRADRAGNGDGRVYRIAFTATDTRGGTCAGSVRVCVPHDQRPGAVCVEG